MDGSATEVVLASSALGFSEAFLEDPDAGLAVMRQALETAERAGSPEDVACAYLHLAELLTGPLNILEEGVVVARRGAERVAELGLGRTYETRLLAIATNGLFRVGQWAEAEKVVAAALRHRPSGADAVELLLARCRLSVGYGDIEAADRDLEAVATVLAGGGRPARDADADPARRPGDVAGPARRGPAGGAARADREPLRRRGAARPRWPGTGCGPRRRRTPAVPCRSTRRRYAGCGTWSSGWPARAPAAGPPGAGVVDGFLALCAAELSRLDGSDPELWAASAAEWDRRNHPYPAAYSRLRQAEALLARRSRAATAGKRCGRRTQMAQGLGAVPLTTRDQRRWPAGPGWSWRATTPRPAPVAAAGARPRRRRRAGGCSPRREREVLAAVAEGLTNREIGQRLFISERTIGVHVSHIFDKLQVRTRVQASAIYLRNPGLSDRRTYGAVGRNTSFY